ncbi:MAG: DNA methylase [Oscillospiraceae bacterium]|nr:DNA methylase [Oscillospiraceae bacterium]
MGSLPLNQIICGDCKDILKTFPNESVDLIVTSPPYADNRKNTYGGIPANQYVKWFLPMSKELLRVLKPTGTFILNIKEKVVDGERSTYVLDLILKMRQQGWLWTEEFIWHKKNCYPGKWPNRFRDAWERCLQFNKTRNFNMYQDSVKVPIGSWADSRLKNLSKTDLIRDETKNQSGFGKKVVNWVGKETVYPTNVLHLATECTNKNHSAAFPEGLPKWFIKLFTQPGDVVLDPFVGSGTTSKVAKTLDRNYIGIDKETEYCFMARQQIEGIQALDRDIIIDFINDHISEFHEKRLHAVKKLNIETILKRKNPYLFKAKSITTCEELVRSLTDAYLSSQEETIFGEFLEKLAIFVCHETMGGFKSGMTGIDLEIDRGTTRYIISIKSGPNWGNSSQIKKMKDNFTTAKKILRTQNVELNVVPINGCCYGRDDKPDKGDYFKYCGQRFWAFVSGDDDFYLDIIEPLGHQARERNDAFLEEYGKLINKLTLCFIQEYCLPDGAIDWEKIVKLNSQKRLPG